MKHPPIPAWLLIGLLSVLVSCRPPAESRKNNSSPTPDAPVPDAPAIAGEATPPDATGINAPPPPPTNAYLAQLPPEATNQLTDLGINIAIPTG